MWTPQYDIIVETLTGSEFEVTVTDKDTIGYIKSRIQKYEGIPIGQQHLLYNHKELSDTTEMKDIPLANGSRLKLVLDMKGGPVSARRVVNLPDYDNWFDISDVLNTTRHDPLTISTPGVKLLVYKDCKKNIHRIMKLRSDRKNYGITKATDGANFSPDGQDDQWVKDNLQTLEKMHQLRSKLEQKKKHKGSKDRKDLHITTTKDVQQQYRNKDDHKIDRNDRLEALSNHFKTQTSNVLDLDPCLKTSTSAAIKQENQPTRRSSCGLLNKYGLNKTCIRPPSVIAQPKKNEHFFQLHGLTPVSPIPPPIYSAHSASNHQLDIDLQTKYASQNMNIMKNSNCNNLTINRPKCKPITNGNNNTNNFCSDDVRSKLRENIRRNRSFKTINTNDPLLTEEIMQRPYANGSSLSSVLDHIFSTSCKKTVEKQTTSKSVQDLIEKLSSTKIGHKSNDSINDLSKIVLGTEQHQQQYQNHQQQQQEREIRLPKRANCLSAATSSGFENKLFIDRQQTIGLNSIDTSGGCASDFKLENSSSTTNSALDGSFRLYKMSSEAKNNYELPKLLIREDSPVESFHSSDPQLETLTLRGESPKNAMDAYPKLTTAGASVVNTTACDRETKSNKSIIKSPWNHRHHSDLGLNNLELNFLNEEYSDLDKRNLNTDNCLHHHHQNGSVLKIASNLEINSTSWNNSTTELDSSGVSVGGSGSSTSGGGGGRSRQSSQPSTTSLNFINGDLTSSDDDDDEEDVFNGSCCMLHSNSKSKSIELNDFRMMFGSSPTLLNTTNYNSVTHTSRLDAVPIQYRRGYTNLNDACLSSSTSDLELFNGVRKKNSSKSASQELPSSFSRHHRTTTNGSLDFVRSYENLDRTKILRMKNERSRLSNNNIINNSNNSDTKHFWESSSNNNNNNNCNNNSNYNSKRCLSNNIQNNFSRERLQEEDFNDDYSYSNLGYDNTINGSNCTDDVSCNNTNGTSECLPIGFPSDESIFNMNLDRFTDDFNLLSATSLSDRSSSLSSNNVSNNSSKETSRSSLIEIDIDGIATLKKITSNNRSNNNNDGLIDKNNILLSSTTSIPFNNNSNNNNNNNNNENSHNNSTIVSSTSLTTTTTIIGAASSLTSSATNLVQPIAKKSERQRCAECNKKLGLIMIMKCHCEKVFCPQHRYAEAHNCSYNFKSEGKKILARENPLVVAQKLPKI